MMGRKKGGYQQPMADMSQSNDYIFSTEPDQWTSNSDNNTDGNLYHTTSNSSTNSQGYHHSHHHNKPSLLKSLTGLSLGSSSSNKSCSNLYEPEKIIGASHSHLDILSGTLKLDSHSHHSHHNNNSTNSDSNNNNMNSVTMTAGRSRISETIDRDRRTSSSVRSNGSNSFDSVSTKSPRHSFNSKSSSKKWKDSNAILDDDDDWNDDLDTDAVVVSNNNSNLKRQNLSRISTNTSTNNTTASNLQFYPNLDDFRISQPRTSSPIPQSNNNNTSSNTIGNSDTTENPIINPKIDPSILLSKTSRQVATTTNSQLYPFLKPTYEDMMKDPFSILTIQEPPENERTKYNKIVKALTNQPFQMDELRKQAWSGVPSNIRSLVWQVLLGYISMNPTTRESVLNRKRKEYTSSITQLFQQDKNQSVWHQIIIDIPRTNPTIKLYSYETTQRSLERILYLWAVRHPASGYVQGINDLVTPIYQVFLQNYLNQDIDVENFDPKFLPKELMNCIESDTFWCLTKILDTIQDNYIHEQPGILRQIKELSDLVKRDEPKLSDHFEKQGIEFIQFAFRWMNCMLMRELTVKLIIRMWDTYISNYPTGFKQFHVYVCCAFLRRFSDELLNMDFQDIIIFLQDSTKTKYWDENDVEMMLSEAFIWQSLYENASAHLK